MESTASLAGSVVRVHVPTYSVPVLQLTITAHNKVSVLLVSIMNSVNYISNIQMERIYI